MMVVYRLDRWLLPVKVKGDKLMCIGVPVKIVEITNSEALIELDGVQQRINIKGQERTYRL